MSAEILKARLNAIEKHAMLAGAMERDVLDMVAYVRELEADNDRAAARLNALRALAVDMRAALERSAGCCSTEFEVDALLARCDAAGVT